MSLSRKASVANGRLRQRVASGLLAALVVGLLLSGPGLGTAHGTASSSPRASSRLQFGNSYGAGANGGIVANATHDLLLTASNTTALAGQFTTFTASIPGTGTEYRWIWGDGTTTNTSVAQTTHAFTAPGIYLIYAAANTSSGTWHDNLGSLLRFVVQDSFAYDVSGNLAQPAGTVVSNTTNQSEAVAMPGGFVQFSNWIAEMPTNPNWQVELPSYILLAPSGTANISSPVVRVQGLDAITTGISKNATSGSYDVVFTVPSVDLLSSGSGPALSNFTFTLFVGAATVGGSPLARSPHAGLLEVYQNETALPITQQSAQGGSFTLDPAVATTPDSLGLIENVYQTLISFNGSSVGPAATDFVPNLAVCVPGSPLCESLFGSPLVTVYPNGTAFTFVMNPNATFFNSTTGAHLPVRPNDVAFSLVRSCLWANIPGVGGGASGGDALGSHLCYSLLPNNGNQSWDGGLHAYLNNTPSHLLSAIQVNESGFCSPTMMDGIHGAGCVTLTTNGYWPDFLAFLASPSEAIVSCDWLATQGSGLPGWVNGSVCSAAPPDPAPAPTAWDAYMRAIPAPLNGSTLPDPARFDSVGSAPYFLQNLTVQGVSGQTPVTISYSLKANPYWAGTTCRGGPRNGCLPSSNGTGSPLYIPRVWVNITANSSLGDTALSAGTADLVQLPPSDASFGLSGISRGNFGMLQVTTPVISFFTMDLNYSPTNATSYLGQTPTLPSWGLQDFAFRSFLSAAYPHAASQRSVCSPGGTEFCSQYGGLIPAFVGNYTPTNITWPVTDPGGNASVPGTAAWWWNQTAHDAMVGRACNASAPCTLPIAIPQGDSSVLTEANAFVANVESISGGAIAPLLVPINQSVYPSTTYYYNSCNPNPAIGCRGPSPFALTWEDQPAPYDQPIDYFGTMAMVNGPHAGIWAQVEDQVHALTNYSSPCAGPITSPTIAQDCQYTAIWEADSILSNASNCLPSAPCAAGGPSPALPYNMADNILTNLSLYVPLDQASTLDAFAPWIDPTSLDLNPELATFGVEAEPFYDLAYRSIIPQGYPLTGGVVTSVVAGSAVGPFLPTSTASAAELVYVGQTVPLLLSVSGGTGVYHYSWYDLPPGCVAADRPVLYCTPSVPGTYAVGANITDSDGQMTRSSAVTMNVYASLALVDVIVAPSSAHVDQPFSLNVTTTGGIPPLRYNYSGLPSGCLSQDAPTVACTPSRTGQYIILVSVHDARSQNASENVIVNVSSTGPLSSPPSGGGPYLTGYLLYSTLTAAVVAVAAAILIAARSRRRRRSGGESSGEEPPYGVDKGASSGSDDVVPAREGESDPAGDLFVGV